jgi:hypothetical protein
MREGLTCSTERASVARAPLVRDAIPSNKYRALRIDATRVRNGTGSSRGSVALSRTRRSPVGYVRHRPMGPHRRWLGVGCPWSSTRLFWISPCAAPLEPVSKHLPLVGPDNVVHVGEPADGWSACE